MTDDVAAVRRWRNSKLYRPLARLIRIYNRRIADDIHAKGFTDFSPAFGQVLSNLDTVGTRVGVLAARAGVSRQAAGKLISEIERCGYVQRKPAADDARAIVVRFTPRGRRLLEAIWVVIEEFEAEVGAIIGERDFGVVRAGLARIADKIDPGGVLGAGDE